MSKENEAFAREAPDEAPGSNPSSQTGPAIIQPTYNTMPPQTQCVVPGPVANPVYGYGAGSASYPVQAPRVIREKSVVEAYLLWFILGPIGGHHFYLGRPGFGVLYFFTFGLLGCGFLFDLFRMPCLVKRANKRLKDSASVEEKTISDAYVLWFPFGLLGFHHFYLNRPGWGVLYFFTLGLFGIGWLVDLFRIPSLVKQANNQPLDKREKQVCTAYAIGLLPSGILGGHHFYLNRHVFGLVYFFTFGNFGVGWIVDWFRMPLLVKRANKHIAFGDDGKRYVDDAYVLWFPLGLLGAHHFYLRRPVWGLLYFFTFGLLGVGWIVDGFRMHCLTKDANKLNEERRRLATSTSGGRNGVIISAPPHTVVPNNGYVYPTQQLPAGAHPQQQQQQYQQQQYQQQHGVYQTLPPSYQAQQNPMPSYVEQPPPYSPAGYPASTESKQ